MPSVYISMGSNMGDRFANLKQACSLISQSVGVIENISDIYETAPWGENAEARPYLNLVLKLTTKHDPMLLLVVLKNIEKKMGRPIKSKAEVYLPRVIDLDILFFDDLVYRCSVPYVLTIPHRLLHLRRFVLLPLSELDSDFEHPKLKKTIKKLLEKCKDLGEITLTTYNIHE
jgi:2-amino-4-hydroxy-6-hydroxymethyldihydropteridine diphosphokinase